VPPLDLVQVSSLCSGADRYQMDRRGRPHIVSGSVSSSAVGDSSLGAVPDTHLRHNADRPNHWRASGNLFWRGASEFRRQGSAGVANRAAYSSSALFP
jgi:hypothetical protein